MGVVSSNLAGTQIVLPKCPSPFESAGNMSCVMSCPTETGYERRPVQGGFRCVYKADPQYSTPLNTVAATSFQGTTLEDVKKSDPKAYGEYIKERDRFVGELAILDGSIDKDKKIKDAFQRLQDAENVRDKSPEAYQQARTSYYTLKKGEKWIEEEKERLLKAEVQPMVRQFEDSRASAMRQLESQRRTVDVVNGLKDNVLSLKDELKYSADTFKEQLGKVQDAINRENRTRPLPEGPTIWKWLDTLLNIAIVASALYVIFMVGRKFFWRPAVVVPQQRVVYA